MVQAESSWDPAAVSPKGAQGLMQLMPATAQELGVTDPMDPEQNLRGGIEYLSQMMRQFPIPEDAVAAYNFGPGNVSAGKQWPDETVAYVNKVMGDPFA